MPSVSQGRICLDSCAYHTTSNTLEQSLLLLSRVETSAKQTGLHLNNSKTEYIKFKQGEGDLKALNGESLKNVDEFFYL